MNKTILTLGTLLTVAAPVAAAISCGSTPPKTSDEFLSVGALTNTVDLTQTNIKTNVVLDKDGHTLTFPAFVPIKGTRAKSRHPEITTPHPTTVLAEPFTRTSSPGAMDVTGWKPDLTFTKETPKTPAQVKADVAKVAPVTNTVTPIEVEDFKHLGTVLDGHLLVLEGFTDRTNVTKDKVSDMLSKIGINIAQLGISVVEDTITREVNQAKMMNTDINIMTLKNVVFILKGQTDYIKVDINILVK